MAFTAAQREVHDYCDKNDFLSRQAIENFKKKLSQEGNTGTLVYALEKFTLAQCPSCNADGAFKWHLLGKLTHPACNRSWYVTPGTYILKSIKDVFHAGVGAGGELGLKENKKGESGGFIGFIVGFIVGTAFRGAVAVCTIPIQAVVSFSQKKD